MKIHEADVVFSQRNEMRITFGDYEAGLPLLPMQHARLFAPPFDLQLTDVDVPAGRHVGLLLTDLSMPKMNGIELVRAARQKRRDLPAIILTGKLEMAMLAIDGITGANCTVLHKPLRLADLPDEIRTVLNKAKEVGRLTAAARAKPGP